MGWLFHFSIKTDLWLSEKCSLGCIYSSLTFEGQDS